MRLDVTDPAQVAEAAATAGDVNIVINNAGTTGERLTLLDGDFDAARRAHWSLTNSLREGLRDQGTLVVAVYAGFLGTDLAEQTMQALQQNQAEVLADQTSRDTKASLSRPVEG